MNALYGVIFFRGAKKTGIYKYEYYYSGKYGINDHIAVTIG